MQLHAVAVKLDLIQPIAALGFRVGRAGSMKEILRSTARLIERERCYFKRQLGYIR
jgi:hypothetical protein